MNKSLSFLLIILSFSIGNTVIGQSTMLTFQNAFKLNDLNRIELQFSDSDWRYPLREVNTFSPVEIKINGGNKLKVKISRKGNTASNNTRDRDKIPFKIDGPGSFNFKLNNNYRDYTMGAREYLAYNLHKAYSGIGSDVTPAEVYIQGEFYGLYLVVEDLNQKFYEDNVGGVTQRIKGRSPDLLYGKDQQYSDLFWLGEKLDYYEERYEIKKGNAGELLALMDVINNKPEEAYKHIDIEQVCKFLAVENYLINVDGIIGEVYSHNYELIKRKSDSKWQLVPWDLNLCLGAWTKPGAAEDEDATDAVFQFPLTGGADNNALVAMIMDNYFFLYHYHYRKLIEEFDPEVLMDWAMNYKVMLDKSKQIDEKLYSSGTFQRAYFEDLDLIDGFVTGLIPTINKRHAFITSLELDNKFSNKILEVNQVENSVYVVLKPDLKSKGAIIEYKTASGDWKKIRAMSVKGTPDVFKAVLPNEAVSYFVNLNHKGVRYSFPYNGILDPLQNVQTAGN